MGRRRAVVLGLVTLLMVIHFVQWFIMGSTVSPIEPSETMYTLQNGAVNAGFIFFTLAILATLIFGRFVCGWGCHIIALQDASGWLLKKIGLKPRPFRSRLLMFVPLVVALYMFVWPTVGRWLTKPAEQPLWPQFTNHLITSEFWATFPSFWVAVPFLFVCGFLTVYFLGNKGFCTYACPYGGFFAVVDRVAPGRIRVTDACSECGECTAVCTSNVVVHREVKDFGMVVNAGCMKCMDCVAACPNDALYFGFGAPALSTAFRRPPAATMPPKGGTPNALSWPLEILAAAVFGLSFFAFWDVYQLVPMLMALGIAAVSTYLVIRSATLVARQDLSFYRWVLRSQGRMQLAGWLFLAVSAVWTMGVAHSGLVRYHERAGLASFAEVQVPEELALAQANPSEWLPNSDRQNIDSAKGHLYNAFDAGFIVNTEVVTRAAWLEFLSGNAEQSRRMFGIAIPRQKGPQRALSLYYRGAIAARQGDYEAAITDLNAAVTQSPDLVVAEEERGVALWHLGRRDDAINAWTKASDGNALVSKYMLAAATNNDQLATSADVTAPNDPYFHWMVGLRLADLDMKQPAESHFQRAVQLDPKFILRRKPKN